MSKSDVGLAAFVVRQLEDAVTKKPCARCGGDHELTKCPMGPNQGYKGILWKGWSQLIRDKADAWVKGRDDYNPPAIAPKKVATSTRTIPSRGGGTGAATATSTDVKKRVPWTAVHDYRNTVTTTEMHYPAPQGIASDLPIGDGMTWILPSQMGKRSKLLRLKDDAKYALRADFFPNNGKTVILTNHFEYNLNTNEFYEYKILDLGTKNRKKLKALISSAINNWPFLQQNQTSFTTNWIDTIVAWKSLHDDLKDGTDVENGAIEWGPHSIPLGNNAVTTRFKFVKIINTHGLHQYAAANPSYEHYNFDDIARCLNIVISKSFGAPVHKVSSNKFFVKNARNGLWNNTTNHPSNSLEIIRGYHYNVKPGMGNIILNFNISTSAVFRPILVSEFMTDPETFNADRLTHILMGKTVYIHLSRKNNDQAKQDRLNSEESRYWKILELQQSGSIEDLRFRKKIVHNGQFLTNPDGSYQFEATETRVTDHLTQAMIIVLLF